MRKQAGAYLESAPLQQCRELAREDLSSAAIDDDFLVGVYDALVLRMREYLEDLVPGLRLEDGHAPE